MRRLRPRSTLTDTLFPYTTLCRSGLERIRDYIGASGSQPTWIHAARAFAELNGAVYPGYDIRDWLRLTKRTHKLTPERSEEHTSELQSLMRTPYAVFCLKKNNKTNQ